MLPAWSQFSKKHAQEHDKRLRTENGQKTRESQHQKLKHLVQKLVDNDVPPNEIIQITGHKNVNSLNNYSTLSDKKQQQISAVLSNTASTSKTLSTVSIEEKTESARFLPDSSTGGLFQNCKIGTVNVQVYSGRAEQPSRIRSEKRLKITVSDDSSQSQ